MKAGVRLQIDRLVECQMAYATANGFLDTVGIKSYGFQLLAMATLIDKIVRQAEV